MPTSTRAVVVRIVERLAARPESSLVTNPYTDEIRRRNLARYLAHLLRRRPAAALIGEAPSWRGGGVTGIPFAAFEDLCAPAVHGVPGPWELPLATGLPLYEASARVVRGAIGRSSAPILVWNVFPWHPHPPGRGDRNRRPTPSEIREGLELLGMVLGAVKTEPVLAVGRVAESALTLRGIAHRYVRHPAHGGARAFQAGVGRAVR
jgi:uracil-DNA glycosylase